MEKYELLNPVFEVKNALNWGERRDLCVVPYVRLMEPVSRGEAIRRLTIELAAKYQTSQVRFAFWANGTVSGSGSPQEIA